MNCFKPLAFAIGLAGALNALATTISPITDGLVLHLDAQDVSTLTRAATTELVSSWASKVGTVTYTNANTSLQPWYESTAFNGKGGVVFGLVKPDDSSTAKSSWTRQANWLQGSESLKHSSVVIITDVYREPYGSGYDLLGRAGALWYEFGHMLLNGGYNKNCIQYLPSYAGTGDQWMNGSNIISTLSLPSGVCYPFTGEGTARLPGIEIQVAAMKVYYQDTWMSCLGQTLKSTSANAVQLNGAVGEVLLYNRILTSNEVFRMQAYINEKWLGAGVYEWKDDVTGAWDEPSNWKGGAVPSGDDAIVIVSSGHPTLTGTAVCDTIFIDNATLTLSSGSEFTVRKWVSDTDTASIEVNAATLNYLHPVYSKGFMRIPNFVGSGTATFTGDCTLRLPNSFEWELGNVSIGGTLTLKGEGLLRFRKANVFTSSGALDVRSGIVDLNGLSQTVASLSGVGIVKNSSATPATLTVNCDSDGGKVTTALRGAIDLVRTGSGKVLLNESSARSGVTTLGGGVTEMSPYVHPVAQVEAVPVLHLDAAQKETMTFDADNRVLTWSSTCGKATPYMSRYEFYCHNTVASAPSSWGLTIDPHPYYDETAFDGRGAVRFGYAPDGKTKGWTYLVCPNVTIPARTILIAVEPDSSIPAQAGLFGMFEESYGILYNNGSDGYNNGQIGNSRGRINGVDLRVGGSGSLSFTKGVRHLLTITFPTEYYTNPYYNMGYAGGAALRSIGLGAQSAQYQRFMRGSIGEVIVYNALFSDDQLKRIEASLMKKWGIVPGDGFDGAIGTVMPTNVTMTAGATLDLGGSTNVINKLAYESCTITNGSLSVGELEVKATAEGVLPLLTSDFDWNVNEVLLSISGCAKPQGGAFLRTSGTVTGTFDEESSVDLSKVRIHAHSISYSAGGLMILFR